MAHNVSDHDFPKLRLDTRQYYDKSDSPFANLSQSDHVASSAFSSSELLDGDDSEVFRPRGASVSFNMHATLDDGQQHSLDEPLPKPTSLRRRPRGISAANDDPMSASAPASSAESSPYRINPFTGEPVRRRTKRSEMAPRMEKTESAQLQDDTQPSLTSGSTASIGSLKSPSSPSNSYMMSSTTVASPVMSPSLASEPWSMCRPRDKIGSRTASLRNTSRRSSRMSGSSMSPASAFLSQWGKDSMASVAPDPDDEGQPLGEQGQYVIGRQVGFGGFSVVKEIIAMEEDGRKTKQAVKIVRKTPPNTAEPENEKLQMKVEHEISIWRYLQHEHIMPLHSVYDTDYATFCIMDLVEGGSLFDLVRSRRKSGQMGVDAKLAKTYAYQLASALRYLHEDVRIVHRDVKLENCLIAFGDQDTPATGGCLKLCDFGLADFTSGGMTESVDSLDSNNSRSEPVGTLQYAAPEVLTSPGSHLQPPTDIWAFGVCLYTMVTGNLPFTHSLQSKIAEMISDAQWDQEVLKKAVHDDFPDLNELICGCLTIDTDSRWTISEILDSPWFTEMQDMTASTDSWQVLSRHSSSRIG